MLSRPVSPRAVLLTCLGVAASFSAAETLALDAPPIVPIDRAAVVARHAVHNTRIDPEAALTLGNGDFALSIDITGLQGLERIYHDNGLPLETRTTWAWHTFPNPDGLTLGDAMAPVKFFGRTILYPTKQHTPAGEYFRENPQPMPMGQLSFTLYGDPLRTEDIAAVDQTLDLWTGIATSHLTVRGQPLEVVTVADGNNAIVAVQAHSPLIASGDLQVRLHFPYAYRTSIAHKPPFIWEQPDKHTTTLTQVSPDHARLDRVSDTTRYATDVRWSTPAAISEVAKHDFRLRSTQGDTLTFTCAFSDEAHPAPAETFDGTAASSKQMWKAYWSDGGIVDFSACKDRRASELERRTILSLYLMKVNYAGSFPPAETGLEHLSWYGKHNSEVYYWHAAQFYQWGHPELIAKGLTWYHAILPQSIERAKAEGFDGARWPKMSGIDGGPSPGGINPYIIWNEPNPIMLSELLYRASPEKATLERYKDLVFESAKFLASFAQPDDAGVYHLGPPLKNVSESTHADLVRDPTFELAAWYRGLTIAQDWRERLGMPRDPLWDNIRTHLAKPPTHDGLYLEIDGIDDIYAPGRKSYPTSMLMALGYLPPTPLIDVGIMRHTFDTINQHNGVDHWLSWQMGQGALTAARLGEPAVAVDILTNDSDPACFMPSGYVRRAKDPDGAVAYLPVNSAFLSAVALMAGGWDGAPDGRTPGFPQDGQWDVRAEGLLPMP